MLRRSVAYRIQNPKEAHDAHLQTTEVGLKQTARGISVARAGRSEARAGRTGGVHGAPEGAAICQEDDHSGSRHRRTVTTLRSPCLTKNYRRHARMRAGNGKQLAEITPARDAECKRTIRSLRRDGDSLWQQQQPR